MFGGATSGQLSNVVPIPKSKSNPWVFPKIGVLQNGWLIMENPTNKWMIWGENPLFSETSTIIAVIPTKISCHERLGLFVPFSHTSWGWSILPTFWYSSGMFRG